MVVFCGHDPNSKTFFLASLSCAGYRFCLANFAWGCKELPCQHTRRYLQKGANYSITSRMSVQVIIETLKSWSDFCTWSKHPCGEVSPVPIHILNIGRCHIHPRITLQIGHQQAIFIKMICCQIQDLGCAQDNILFGFKPPEHSTMLVYHDCGNIVIGVYKFHASVQIAQNECSRLHHCFVHDFNLNHLRSWYELKIIWCICSFRWTCVWQCKPTQ